MTDEFNFNLENPTIFRSHSGVTLAEYIKEFQGVLATPAKPMPPRLCPYCLGHIPEDSECECERQHCVVSKWMQRKRDRSDDEDEEKE